jgi:hypothetical protein
MGPDGTMAVPPAEPHVYYIADGSGSLYCPECRPMAPLVRTDLAWRYPPPLTDEEMVAQKAAFWYALGRHRVVPPAAPPPRLTPAEREVATLIEVRDEPTEERDLAELIEYREERAAIGQYERGMSRADSEAAAIVLVAAFARTRRQAPGTSGHP